MSAREMVHGGFQSGRGRRRERLPDAADAPLDGAEAGLVGHLAAVADPVAQVEVGQPEFAADLDLPQDAEGAEAAAGQSGS
jgi:hypothetical protein